MKNTSDEVIELTTNIANELVDAYSTSDVVDEMAHLIRLAYEREREDEAMIAIKEEYFDFVHFGLDESKD